MYGLVLEGGGAKGSYHIGAYKAIKEMGIEIKGITGTSVGALNGALICQGDFEKAYELWSKISYSQVIDLKDDRLLNLIDGEFKKGDIKVVKNYLKDIVSSGGIDASPLRKLIDGLVDEDKMRKSKLDFGMVTISLTDFRPLELFLEDIPVGRVSDYLLASAYFPAFKNDEIAGKHYLDGGLYNNLPVNLLKDRGYKDIIQVRTFGIGHVKRLDTSNLNIISIEPREDLGGTLEFNEDRAGYNLKLGYYDGLRAFKGLKGNSYYLETNIRKEDIYSYLWKIDSGRIGLLKKSFRIDEKIDDKRALFEHIIPRLARVLGAKKEDDYEDIFYKLVESLADYYSLERFKIYGLTEILGLIKANIIREYSRELSNKPLKGHGFKGFLKDEDVLREIGFVLF